MSLTPAVELWASAPHSCSRTGVYSAGLGESLRRHGRVDWTVTTASAEKLGWLLSPSFSINSSAGIECDFVVLQRLAVG